jgi:chemotaxis protein MotA
MILSWIGFILGVFGIIIGQVMEGGHLGSLVQPTAALIVFGGTLGSTLLSSTMAEFSGAIRSVPKVFLRGGHNFHPLIKEIVSIASVARREGILSLERYLKDIKSPFFAHNLRHIVDGYDPAVLKEMMEDRIMLEEEEKVAIAKVWEAAGGFSPTIGILGAVLGLIHVMENLSDSSKLGSGIAVAFVATVYGVGAANLILLPIANKLKKIAKEECVELQLIAAGLSGIQNGLNPRIIEDRLNNILGEYTVLDEKGNSTSAGEKKAA